MQVTTWIDRITDQNNAWLNAVKAEDEHDFSRAIVSYLADAANSLSRGSTVKGALSVSCAADCLGKLGMHSYARRLNLVAASLYLHNANAAAGSSIRELVWSLKQSYLYFAAAGDLQRSEEAYGKYRAVAMRIDPFEQSRSVELDSKVEVSRAQADKYDPKAAGAVAVVGAVERFLQFLREGRPQVRAGQPENPKPKDTGRFDEKGIISQLG
jgi:hypothetical protein